MGYITPNGTPAGRQPEIHAERVLTRANPDDRVIT
jgi:hypothetical protein